MFSRGGNQVGALLYDNGTLRTVPPGTGRRHVLYVAAELNRTRPGANGNGNGNRRGNGHGRVRRDRAKGGGHRGTTDLAAMLDAVAKLARRRSLIIVISDFIGDGDWERSLLRLGPRHEVVALRVVDAADDELPAAGLVVIEDAETGEQLIIDSGDPLLRTRLRSAVDERDASVAAGMRRAGVPMHRIDTTADLASTLVEVVTSTKRGRR
jgi:uncharacterized protein (DUF58 family)